MLVYAASLTVSTGNDFGSRRSSCRSFDFRLSGVEVPLAPGVVGGVKAGEMSVAGNEGVEEPS